MSDLSDYMDTLEGFHLQLRVGSRNIEGIMGTTLQWAGANKDSLIVGDSFFPLSSVTECKKIRFDISSLSDSSYYFHPDDSVMTGDQVESLTDRHSEAVVLSRYDDEGSGDSTKDPGPGVVAIDGCSFLDFDGTQRLLKHSSSYQAPFSDFFLVSVKSTCPAYGRMISTCAFPTADSSAVIPFMKAGSGNDFGTWYNGSLRNGETLVDDTVYLIEVRTLANGTIKTRINGGDLTETATGKSFPATLSNLAFGAAAEDYDVKAGGHFRLGPFVRLLSEATEGESLGIRTHLASCVTTQSLLD